VVKKFLLFLATAVVCLIVLTGSQSKAGQQDIGSLISLANQEYNQRYVIQASYWQEYLQGYQPHLESALSLFESVALDPAFVLLPVQSQAFVYNHLSQLYYEATVYHLEAEEEYFAQGRDYGLKSLRLNEHFSQWEDRDFAEAVGFVNDPAALLFTANNWGSWLNYHPLVGLSGGVKKVMVLYRRLMEVSPSYWGGSVYNALGAMLVTIPSFLGGDQQQGLEYLKQGVELFPDYLENHVVYADYAGFNRDMMGNRTTVRDLDLIQKELEFVLQTQPDYNFPFWNWEAKREAEQLWQEAGLP